MDTNMIPMASRWAPPLKRGWGFWSINRHSIANTLQHNSMENTNKSECGKDVSLQELRDRLTEFARERDWEKYHSPRNLLLALVGEVGELSEIFQWKGEVAKGLPNWSDEEKEHLEEELSDVLLYLVQLAHVCGLDLGQAALSKILKNANKYPIS